MLVQRDERSGADALRAHHAISERHRKRLPSALKDGLRDRFEWDAERGSDNRARLQGRAVTRARSLRYALAMQKPSAVWIATLACSSLGAACASSNPIPRALSLEAPFEQRMAQYRRYRMARTERTIYQLPRTCGTYGCTTTPPIEYNLGRLANGLVVTDPVVLAPLVASESTTAQRARSAQTFETAGVISYVSIVPLGAVGTSLLFGGGALGWRSDTTLYVSVPMLVVAGLALISGTVFREVAGDLRKASFRSFNSDFRDHLGLCSEPVPPAECSEPTRSTVTVISAHSPSAPLAATLSLRF